MCVSGLLLTVALSVTNTVPLAQYNSVRGIELSPTVCEMPADTVRFVVYHELAHHELSHIPRKKQGEPLYLIEVEADTFALNKLKEDGIDTCAAVKPILKYRGFFSSTHPSRFTLESLACGE